MQDMFYNNSLLDNIDVSTFNTKNVIDMGANVIVMGSSVFKGNIEENMAFYNKFK